MPQINRRQFLKLAGLLSAGAGLIACDPVAPAVSGQLMSDTAPAVAREAAQQPQFSRAVHLLNRLTFGPRPGDVERVEAMGYEAFIEEQLSSEKLDTGRAEAIVAGFTTLTSLPSDREQGRKTHPIFELNAATLARALYSEQQLYEIVVDFWSNHFNIFQGKGPTRFLKIIDDRAVIRPHALGTFRQILGASAHSPAMLYYLDNFRSHREGPNENYARELLELHTLGVDGGYTQQDVEQTARAFTGWSIARHHSDTEPVRFQFKPRFHDYQTKTVLGHELPADQGQADGEMVLDILATHPSTARHISRKLCVRFISDNPPDSIVEAAATTFSQTNGDIEAVLRTIFNSDQFWNSAGQKVKRPLEFLISILRATEVEVESFKPLVRALENMGQLLFMWPAPNGYPDVGPAWINTNGLLARWNLALKFVEAGDHSEAIRFDLRAPLKAAPDNLSPAEILDLYTGLILHRALPDEAYRLFLDLLKKDTGANLPLVIALLIASPYFQYR